MQVLAGLSGKFKNMDMVLVKHSENLFKKIHKQHALKHFKDLCSIRRQESSALRRYGRNHALQTASPIPIKEDNEGAYESFCPVDWNNALCVAKGLIELLMNASSPCCVDSFLLTCKVR